MFKAEAQTSVLNMADSLYGNGKYAKAIEQYKMYNKPNEVYYKIANAYIALGNYDEALLNFELAIATNPKNLLLKYDYAKLLSNTKNFTRASEEFNKLIKTDSLNPNYHYELGLVLEQLNDSTSQKQYLKTFKLDQTHQKAIYKIAKFYLQKRKHDSATYYINIGLKTYANNKELINLKAQNYYWLQDYKNAVIWFEKLLEIGESSEFIHEKLSLSYEQLYEYEQAIEHRLLALKYNPNNATACYVLGTYYEKLSDFENAEKYISQSLLIIDQPLDAEYRKLGTVLNQQNKHKKAIEAFKKAINEDPKNEFSSLYLAFTLEAYYADYDAKINAFENFKMKFPSSDLNKFVDGRILELKKEKFLKENKKED
ncbi:tetratricopeptide repeat protein [Yeosuana sp. AK3]